MSTFIALLRGINVGGQKKVPMLELRAICTDLGFTDVQTYIQSGNVVFGATGKPLALEEKMEAAIEKKFGFTASVLIRTTAQWRACVESNPLPEAAEKEPHRLLMALPKLTAKKDAVEELRKRATAGEVVEAGGGAIWFHFPEGIGTSKLTPAVIDRLTGSPVTGRNWRTVQKLAEMAGVGG